MGFYGNIKDIEKNSSFVFDRIYANRKQMDENASTDGIYVGRYILIEYDTEASSLDYKKAYFNKKLNLVNGHYILYYSADFSDIGKILYSDEEFITPGGILMTTTLGTIVYIIEGTKNIYYTCVGYFEIDENGVTTMYVNGKSQTLTDPSIKNYFSEGKKYAIFDKVTNSSITSQNNYANNYNIDIQYAKEKGFELTGHGWDSTVWQKTLINGQDKYVMVAELNTVVPTFDISVDAPTQMPIAPHFDAASTDVYYNLHWQSPWGMRIQHAGAEHSDGSAIQEPNTDKILSDETTTWIRKVYNKETDKITMYYYTTAGTWRQFATLDEIGENGRLPAAIYYNKAGFNPKARYISSLKDKFTIDTTGYSQSPDDKGQWADTQYNSHIPGKTQHAVDTQEISMVLPGIGNAISQMWDVVYGTGSGGTDKVSERLTDISWKDSPVYGSGRRLQLIQSDGEETYTYHKTDVETLAGAINSVHDLMGMIIQEKKDIPEDFNFKEFAENSANNDAIYYLGDKFYRKAPSDDLKPLNNDKTGSETDGYIYEEATEVTEQSYNNFTYYIKKNDLYEEATGTYDAQETYYIRKVNGGIREIPISTFESIMDGKKYYWRNSNGDFIYDKTFYRDKQYFTIDETKVSVVTLDSTYEPNKYYYLEDENYYLDKKLDGPTQAFEYIIDGSPVRHDARYIYEGGRFYSAVNDEKDKIVYKLDLRGLDPTLTYYRASQAMNGADIANRDKNALLAYRRKKKEQITRLIDGEMREIYLYTYNDDSGVLEVWKETSTKYYDVLTNKLVDLTLGTVEPSYKYIYETPNTFIQFVGDEQDIIYENETKKPVFYTYNPSDAKFQSVNELYILTPTVPLDKSISAVNYYKLIDDNYIKVKLNSELPEYDASEPEYFYTLSFKQYSNIGFYQSDLYYYKDEIGKSWYFDGNGAFVAGRKYYTIPKEAIKSQIIDLTDVYLYESGKYYYRLNNRYYIDNNAVATPNRQYYLGNDYFFVYEDTKGILPLYSHWNTQIPVTHNITLGVKNDNSYTMKPLVGFARTLNTIHGLLLEINNFLEYGNETTRNTSTVQGTLNTLNDIIAKIEILDCGHFMVTDSYGRMHSAPSITDEWITTHIDPDVSNPKVYITHNKKNKIDDVTAQINLNTNKSDTIEISQSLSDAAGHITNKELTTITLPYGIQELNADSGSYKAQNTHDSFSIKTTDNWLNTKINNNELLIEHENAQTAVNTKGLLQNSSPNFGNKFVIPKVSIDGKGHVNTLEEYEITLPKVSSSMTDNGNVITAVNLEDTTGAFNFTKTNLGDIVLSSYSGNQLGEIQASDTLATAIGKNAYKLSILMGTAETPGSLKEEASVRANADKTLQDNIDILTKVVNDNKTSGSSDLTTLTNTVAENKTASENADSALSQRIKDLEDVNISTVTTGLDERISNLETLDIANKISEIEARLDALENA